MQPRTGLSHELVSATNWSQSRTGLSHELVSVTNWSQPRTGLSHERTGLSHELVSVTNPGLSHELVSVTNPDDSVSRVHDHLRRLESFGQSRSDMGSEQPKFGHFFKCLWIVAVASRRRRQSNLLYRHVCITSFSPCLCVYMCVCVFVCLIPCHASNLITVFSFLRSRTSQYFSGILHWS